MLEIISRIGRGEERKNISGWSAFIGSVNCSSLQLFWASAAFCFINLDRSLSPVHHPCDTILAPLHPGSCGLRCCFHLARRVSLLVLVRMWINTLMLPHLSPERLESSISKRNAISTLHKGNVAPPLCYWCSTFTVDCWCTHLWCTTGSHTLSALLLCYWYTHTPLVSYWFSVYHWCVTDDAYSLLWCYSCLHAYLVHSWCITVPAHSLVHCWCIIGAYTLSGCTWWIACTFIH